MFGIETFLQDASHSYTQWISQLPQSHFTKRALSLVLLKGHAAFWRSHKETCTLLKFQGTAAGTPSLSPSEKICSTNYLQLLLSYIFAEGTSSWLRETPYRNLASRLLAQANHTNLCLSHSSIKKVVKEWPTYSVVCCGTSRGTMECTWSYSFS